MITLVFFSHVMLNLSFFMELSTRSLVITGDYDSQ